MSQVTDMVLAMMGLEDFAEEFGVRIVRADPGEGLWGCYLHHEKTILLHPNLSSRQERFVLAHELGHAYHGHTETSGFAEWLADVSAAKYLIRLCDWVRATAIHETPEAVADELEVHPYAVMIYFEHLGRFDR